MSVVRRLIRKPLLHFSLVGGLLFAIDSWRKPAVDPPIVVSHAVKRELSADLARKLRRDPTSAELEQALSAWKQEEALYREGLREGIDRNDAQVRARVISKLLEVQRALFVPPEPSNAELDAFLNQHRERYELPARYDFEHVFVSASTPDARARANELREELTRGAPSAELGERFSDGRAFKALTAERIRRIFGQRFAAELPNLPVGVWSLVQSDHGYHVVKLELTEGGLPPREALGRRLVEDYRAAALDNALRRYVSDVERRYEFREAP